MGMHVGMRFHFSLLYTSILHVGTSSYTSMGSSCTFQVSASYITTTSIRPPRCATSKGQQRSRTTANYSTCGVESEYSIAFSGEASPQAESWGILSDLEEDISKSVYTSGLAIPPLETHQKKKKKERTYIRTSIYTMQGFKNLTRKGGRSTGVAKGVGRVFGPVGEGKRIAVVHGNKFYIVQNVWAGMEEVATAAGWGEEARA